MSVAENVALMRRWFEEVWNQGRVETVYELCDERTVGMGLAEQGTETHGPEEYVRYLQRLRGAFPDIRITVEDAFGADDKVAVRWSADRCAG
jgi:SnoaL-like polyketide cyclase